MSGDLSDLWEDESLLSDSLSEVMAGLDSAEAKFVEQGKPVDAEGLSEVQRVFHTVKGLAGMFEIRPAVDLAHAAEDLIKALKAHDRVVLYPTVEVLLKTVDLLRDAYSTAISEKGVLSSLLEEAIDRLITSIREKEEEIASGFEDEFTDEAILRIGQILFGGGKVSQEGLQEALSQQRHLGEVMEEKGLVTEDDVEHALRLQDNLGKARKNVEQTFLRIPSKSVDKIFSLIGQFQLCVSTLRNLAKTRGEIARDRLMASSDSFANICQDITRDVTALRMVPIKGIAVKMKRIATSTADKLGKRIDLEFRDNGVLFDKSRLGLLDVVIVHAVRNAVDHGIEDPELRRQQGKDPVGRICVVFKEDEQSITITIEDNGRGIDREKVKKKAVDAGFDVSSSRDLTDAELTEILFSEGFSTADKTTEISGRGVGLNAVQEAVKDLSGKVRLSSQEGNGTKFIIELPRKTVAFDSKLRPFITIQVSGSLFGIPFENLVRLLSGDEEADALTSNRDGAFLMLPEGIAPLYALEKLIDVPSNGCDTRRECLLLIDESKDLMALSVPRVEDLLNLGTVALPELLNQSDLIDATAALPSGEIVQILSMVGLFDAARELSSSGGASEPPRVVENQAVGAEGMSAAAPGRQLSDLYAGDHGRQPASAVEPHSGLAGG